MTGIDWEGNRAGKDVQQVGLIIDRNGDPG